MDEYWYFMRDAFHYTETTGGSQQYIRRVFDIFIGTFQNVVEIVY